MKLLHSDICEARHRVHVRAEDVDYAAFILFVGELFRSRPELGGFDFVCEMRNLSGEPTSEALMAVKDAYDRRPDPGAQAFTIAVATDDFVRHWAGGLDVLFAGRTHKTLPSVGEADAFLDAVRG